ncbi:hypothetical protein [Roseiflexus sp.]|uniref:hypothetical protein n=1 Tax=Roseiflexus sp. TaxID=2562120 RepID=UPI00398B8E72
MIQLHGVPILGTEYTNRVILGYPDHIIETALAHRPYPLFFELICHGSWPDAKGRTFAVPYLDENLVQTAYLDAEALHDIIVTRPAYCWQPVRLLMCWVGYGSNPLAQQLADLLRAPVLAANERISANTLLPFSNGRWIMFKPR